MKCDIEELRQHLIAVRRIFDEGNDTLVLEMRRAPAMELATQESLF